MEKSIDLFMVKNKLYYIIPTHTRKEREREKKEIINSSDRSSSLPSDDEKRVGAFCRVVYHEI